MNRRQLLLALATLGAAPKIALAAPAAVDNAANARVGAAWRGPNKTDTYYAGVLATDWAARRLNIRYALPLPTRPHGITAEADGGLLVIGVRPGTWLLRCDGEGRLQQQVRVDEEESAARLNGHAVVGRNGDVLYTTETDSKTGRGRIGVRDRQSLKKLDEWDSHGLEPHQVLLDENGHLIVANGGVPRTASDRKYDLHRMDSSLVRLDARTGRLLRQWRLADPRLSLRHLAWSKTPVDADAYLGIALQAEHDDAAQRTAAPILAILDEDTLLTPSRANDGFGYAGDIAAAANGGFAVSSNQAGMAQLWHPGRPDKLLPIVELEEAYALTDWAGPGKAGGVLVATGLGLVRWHPTAKPALLPWPQPMALDNHWVLLGEV